MDAMAVGTHTVKIGALDPSEDDADEDDPDDAEEDALCADEVAGTVIDVTPSSARAFSIPIVKVTIVIAAVTMIKMKK